MRRKALLSIGVMLLAGGAQSPLLTAAAATISEVQQRTAIVESVDQTERSVLLRGPNGGLMTVQAGPEVRNLKQVKAGDRVVVRYHEALAVNLAKPGTAMPSVQTTGHSSRAPLGAKPRGSAEHTDRARVRITGIDYAHNLVSFIGPAHVERTLEVLDPELRRFLHTLKVGDEVDVAYTEALAVSVEPMRG